MLDNLIQELSTATQIDKEQISKVLVRTQDIEHGDYAFPCFSMAKEAKLPPNVCAQNLKDKIKLPAGFDKVEAVGPYLNFFLDRESLTKKIIQEILNSNEQPALLPKNSRNMVIDYSGPNIAKNLHVGHMRTTLIGLAIERIYKHLGYNVTSVNHLGDWGVQFGYIWAGVQIWGMPEKANIDSLVEIYVRAVKLGKDQEEGKAAAEDSDKPDISAMAKEYFMKLEADDAEALKFWQNCLDLSLEEFKGLYRRLDINFDYHTGESFYRNQITEVENLIKASGVLEDSRGAKGVDLGKELGFVRIFADDGRSLYITRDIAAALYREKTFNPEKIIYVVAAQQSLHFKQLIEVLRKMKEKVAEKVVHVSFGFVPGMKTREGSAILFRDFLNEAHTLALKTYKEQVSKRPENLDENEIAEKVAIGATYFYFLKHINNKDFNFSWEQALNFQGDSGAYLQYALARIYSIESNANAAGVESDTSSLLKFDAALLKDKESYQLINLLSKFSEVLERAASEYEPSHVAVYTLDLAKSFGKAYNSLRVVGEDKAVATSRLALFIATRTVLKTALYLIGIPTVKRM